MDWFTCFIITQIKPGDITDHEQEIADLRRERQIAELRHENQLSELRRHYEGQLSKLKKDTKPSDDYLVEMTPVFTTEYAVAD